MKELGVLSPLSAKVICTGVQTHSFRTPPLFSPGSTPVVCHVSPYILDDPLHVCSVLCPLSFSQSELCRCYFSSPICPKHPLYQFRSFHGLCQGNFSPQDLLVSKNFPFFSHGWEILESDPHLMTLVGLPVCQMFFSVQEFLRARLLQLYLLDIYCHCGCEFEVVENSSIVVCLSLCILMQAFRDGLPILDGSLLVKDLMLKKDWLITHQSELHLQFGSVQHLGTFFSSLKDLIKDTGYLFNDSDLLGLQNVVVEISNSKTQNVDDDQIVQATL